MELGLLALRTVNKYITVGLSYILLFVALTLCVCIQSEMCMHMHMCMQVYAYGCWTTISGIITQALVWGMGSLSLGCGSLI